MGKFVFIEYTGDDSAIALARILGMHHEQEGEQEELVSQTKRAIGFQPNPEEDDDDEETEVGDDDENTD